MTSTTTTPGDVLAWILKLMYTLLAAGFLGGALWMGADRVEALSRFRRAPGEVVSVRAEGSIEQRFVSHVIEVRYRACPAPSPPPPNPYPFEIPEFPSFRLSSEGYGECLPGGERKPRQSSVRADGPTTLKVGDPVEVLWHPEAPRRVYVNAFSTFWFTPFILGVLGAPIAWYGALMWLDDARRRRRASSSG